MKDTTMRFFKGLLLGLLFMVPGISAAIVAILLNMYDKIIIALSNLRKEFKKNASYLLPIGLGALVGIMLMLLIIIRVVQSFEMFLMFMLLGSLIGSFPLMMKKANVKKMEFKYIALLLIGMVVIISLRFLPASENGAEQLSFLFIMFAGFIMGVSILLPGLCTVPMLAALGLLVPTTQAVSNFDLVFLLPLGVSIAIWIILTIKIVGIGLTKYPSATYVLIAGLMLGSIVQVFPQETPSGHQIPIALFLILFGMAFPLIFAKLSKDNEDQIKNDEVKNDSIRNDEM